MRKVGLLALMTLMCSVNPAWALHPFHAPVMLIAGDGIAGYQDGAFYEAEFHGINDLLLDEANNVLYVADGGNAAIRKIELNQDNHVSTLVGGKKKKAARGLNNPYKMTWGEPGTIFLTDRGDHRVKVVQLDTKSVSTLSGNGKAGYQDGTAKEAMFNQPSGLCYVRQSKKIIVADTGNDALRLVDTESGEVRTLCRNTADPLEFQYVFCNAKGEIITTLRNKPGFWRIYSGKDTIVHMNTLRELFEHADPKNIEARFYVHDQSQVTALTVSRHNLFYNITQPETHRVMPSLRTMNTYVMDQEIVVDYNPWLNQRLNADYQSNTKPAQAVQQYRLFHSAQGMAFHSQNREIFIGDEYNHRIISVRMHERGEFPKGTAYPDKKAVNVKRIMVIGNSMNYSIADRPDQSTKNEELSDSLSKRIEYWLNMLSLSQGGKTQYEVLYAGGAMFYSIPSASYAFGNLKNLARFDVDYVLYDYTYLDLVFDAMRYIKNPYDEGDLQAHGYDPEFLLTPVMERKLHPLGVKLRDYIINNPDKIGMFAKLETTHIRLQNSQAINMLLNRDNRTIFFEVATNELNRYYQQVLKYNQEKNKHVQFIINLIPLPVNISNNEILDKDKSDDMTRPHFLDQMLRAWCKKKNIGFQDTINMVKIIEPTEFPLFFNEENHHYSSYAADVVAFFTASQLFKRFNETQGN